MPTAVCEARNNTPACVCHNKDVHDGIEFDTIAPEGVPCNPNYFKLPVIALVLITILNDGTIISIAYDYVVPHKYPEKWRLPRVIIEATLLGGVACVSSIVLLQIAMNARSDDNDDFLSSLGLKTKLVYNQVTCLMYLKVSISDFLTVFAARTQGFFFMRKPGTALAIAFVVATAASSIFAHLWPFTGMEGIPGEYILFTWIYCILCFFVQDICKVCLNLVLDALMFGRDSDDEDANARKQKDAHRLARVRLAQEKHRHRGTVSSPDLSAQRAYSSGVIPPVSLGGPIANSEDIRLRIDMLAQELERLRAALGTVNSRNMSSGGMTSGQSLGRSGMNSGGISRRTNRSNLSSRSLSHEFVHRNKREKSPSVGVLSSSKDMV